LGRLRIGILSRGASSYSTKRLIEASRARGHSVDVLDTARFSLIVEATAAGGSDGEIRYKGRPLAELDAVIPRIGTSMTLVGAAIVRALEQRGTFVQNGSHAITAARDKLRALQVLGRNGVPIPRTAFVKNGEDLLSVIDALGGAPVILKLLEGTQGVGVMLADTRTVARAILETLESVKADVLLQRFVEESRGRDVRAFVVGGRVVAAMRRTARGEEFRSNVHRGGSVESVALDATYDEVARKAARVLGLHVAGVDMLEGRDGPLVMEVNASPGLEGIEAATGIDVAMAVVRHVEDALARPEEALREIAALDKGHAVAELALGGRNRLVGLTIAESKLDALDVRVLSVRRGSLAMPNPAASTRLFLGDTLVLFGKKSSLEGLVARE
jgi:ribosomal protein S6--L-glutamate ligase